MSDAAYTADQLSHVLSFLRRDQSHQEDFVVFCDDFDISQSGIPVEE